jgi:hypothetical protein
MACLRLVDCSASKQRKFSELGSSSSRDHANLKLSRLADLLYHVMRGEALRRDASYRARDEAHELLSGKSIAVVDVHVYGFPVSLRPALCCRARQKVDIHIIVAKAMAVFSLSSCYILD